MDSFSALLGIQHAFCSKVMNTIFAIEYAQLKNFKGFWLECDFSFF